MPGGGTFRSCERCRTVWVRAEDGRRRITNPSTVALDRAALRLWVEVAARPVPAEAPVPG